MLLEGHFGDRVEDGLRWPGPVEGCQDGKRQAGLRDATGLVIGSGGGGAGRCKMMPSLWLER